MFFGMIKIGIATCFIYLLLQSIKRHHPNSPLIDLFEFILTLLVFSGLAIFMIFAIGLLILL